MKRSLLIIVSGLALLSSGNAQTQTVNREQSNLEKFSSKSGTLIEKQFTDIGKLRAVSIQLLIIKDMTSNAKISGVRFEYYTGGTYGSDRIAFLDLDEVDGLIKSINLIKTSVFNTTKDVYTEIAFKSRSGFEAGCYFADGKWTAYLQIDRFDKNSLVSMRPEDFDQLLSFLEEAKRKVA